MVMHLSESASTQSNIVICPICKATIELSCQDLESVSNFYFCANCGLTLPRPRE